VSTHRFDNLTRTLAQTTSRRRFSRGIGALALGAAPALAIAGRASAGDNERERKCKERCERRCENRDNPNRCNQQCRDRRCDRGD
jgi:hypothetical protein